MTAALQGQQIVSFDSLGWNSNQKIDSSFSVNGYSFSSNESFYTNYGYNFNINSVSLYYVFQNPGVDKITITSPNAVPLSLINFAAYQVSEESTSGLIIEGWYNSILKYSRSFSNIFSWEILTLNYSYINKIEIKLDSSASGSLTDYDFDNFTFRSNITSASVDSSLIPQSYRLSQNFPNPFNPTTKIYYSIPKSNLVTIKIFNILGREVKTLLDEHENAGNYNVVFNASGLSSGVYFCRLQSGDFVSTKKMILIK